MSLPARVGVVGGGQMGAGIAHAFLLAGAAVTVVETSEATTAAARERIARSLLRAEERGVLSGGAEAVLARLTTTVSTPDLVDCELIIEAVPEDVALKTATLRAIEDVASTAWLATNTSSLSIGSLAAGLRHPERFVGLHFFNPVPASSLVEIVVGTPTATELVERARAWVSALGKTAIVVTDSPGFASSRLGVAIALEAMRMLEDGVASVEDIDTAMTLGYRHPTGPLRTTDLVGLDVRLAIAEHLSRELGDRFDPPEILRHKVAAGQLGRKTGQGFYAW